MRRVSPAADARRRWLRPLQAILALVLVLESLPGTLPPLAAAPLPPAHAALPPAAPVPTGSPTIVASLIGAGQVGPNGIVALLVTVNAGAGEMLATLEASASGADGQWQTLATLATPGPVTLSTGFSVTLPAFGGSNTAGAKVVHLRASDVSGNRSTMTLAVTYDPTLPSFGDVPGSLSAAEAEAIRQMAARGVILGYSNGNFGATDTTQRAQMAALIARAMGYGTEDWGNNFSDRGGLIESLWRNVGTLQHYQVAFGYDGKACADRGVGSPCFGPTEPVTRAQTISFITRAMVKRGFWQQRTSDPNPFPNVPQSSGHVADLATYVHYVGAPPGATSGQAWPSWSSDATRGWFAQAEWLVVQWLERSQNWMTLPAPTFPHRAHGVAASANTSDKAPQVGDTVTISAWLTAEGQPVAGAPLTATANFPGSSASCTGTSGGDGWGACQLAVTPAMAGQTVSVDTVFTHRGAGYAARVVLTVPGAASPSPSPSPSTNPSPSLVPSPSPTPSPSPSASPSPSVPPPPPDPGTVAPPLDRSVATSLFDATAFLYTGPNAIQTGVAPDTIEAQRAAALRGTVTTRDGQPLPSVAVSILNHPEFGQTLTRADGVYDLVINGGGPLVVNFTHAGYLPTQRQAAPAWQQYTTLPDVALVPLDPVVTTIEPNASEPFQVAQGSAVTDDDGSRRATLLFPQRTTATMTLPDGSTQPLDTLNVRATEYTVGDGGPAAMPGDLPPASGYTYAVELSVDEALAAGAIDVQFSQPMPFYVENFLGFPVGTPVPVGYYDRAQGRWIADDNGLVIKLLSISGGLANLDVTGDDLADIGQALADLGITDAERAQLATLFAPGTGLWRVAVTHFTPWDLNWPYGPPWDATVPGLPQPNWSQPTIDDQDQQCGSIIGCQHQTLGEVLGVIGTPFTLHYQSDRTLGYAAGRTVSIPLSGPTAPSSLKRIDLVLDIAGRHFEQSFAPVPNQSTYFTWDGRDAFGRIPQGQQVVRIRVGYVYDAVYQETRDQATRSFARLSGVPLSGVSARQEITIWQETESWIAPWYARAAGIGGWTLSVHHAYEPQARNLHLGNGQIRTAAASARTIRTRHQELSDHIAFGPDGSLYFSGPMGDTVNRLDVNGNIVTVAGNGTRGFSGDGGPATQAQLQNVDDLEVGPDGSLFIVDAYRVRRVGPDGLINTVAGTGEWGFAGDGQVATQAQFRQIGGLAAAPDGTLYITDVLNQRIRRIGTDGIITTVAGNAPIAPPGAYAAEPGFSGDGGPARDARLNTPFGIALAPDGSLYIADNGNLRVRRVGTDGLIDTVAGSGSPGVGGDGGAATQAQLTPWFLAIANDGTLYVSDTNYSIVRQVRRDGIIITAAGNGTQGINSDNLPATQAQLVNPKGLAISPDGVLHIADGANGRIRQLVPPLPGLTNGEAVVSSENGAELYVFDYSGRHLRTLHALTGATLYEFAYHSAGNLLSVTDSDGNVTAIERNGDGNPTAIVAPFGQRTELAVNADGYLESVTNPANEQVQLGYGPGGLLIALLDPRGGLHTFAFDALGRLIRDDDPAGGYKVLGRTDDATSYTVTVDTRLGRQTTYRVEHLPTGGVRRTVIDPSGAQTVTISGDDGTTTATAPDGTVTVATLGPDPRWGMLAPLLARLMITTPAGLTYEQTTSRTVALTDPDNPLSLSAQTDTITTNGRISTVAYAAALRTTVVTTPEGRQTVTVIDAQGRTVRHEPGVGLAAQVATFDTRGLLVQVSRGDQTKRYRYDTRGRVSTIRDAADNEIAYTYDDADRIATITLPGGDVYGYAYDGNGNRARVTMPGGGVHTIEYTPVDLESAYTAPGGTAQTLGYDYDRAQSGAALPGGRVTTSGFDPGGRLTGLAYPEATITFGYTSATARVGQSVRAPSGGGTGQTIGTSYDGELVTAAEWSGVAQGRFAYTYDDDFLATAITLTSGADVAALTLSRDDDGLLTGNGPYTFGRDGPGGMLSAIGDGTLNVALTHDGAGRLSERTVTVGAQQIYHLHLAYNTSGKITQRIEKVGGVTRTYDYTYDRDGQLIEEALDGVTVVRYTYGPNGNRISRQRGGDPADVATYDLRDRLQTLGGTTYHSDIDGFVVQRGAETFAYSTRGELLSATVGGQTITYAYDALGRRVGRTDSIGTTQYLYGNPDNQFQITAVRDAAGVLTTFAYDEGDHLFAFERGSTRYYVAVDQVGTPRVVIDGAGQVVKALDYDSFGVPLTDSDPAFDLPIGFAGGLADPATGLLRFGMRDYDPTAGRWTAPDRLLFAGGEPNLYAYTGNDPVGHVDPNGLLTIGGSAYLVFGSGGKLTITNKGASLCAEAGIGVGGGIDVDLFSNDLGTEGGYTESKASAKFGPARLTFGARLDKCGGHDLTGLGLGIGSTPYSVEFTPKGVVKGKWGAGGVKGTHNGIGVGLKSSLSAGACRRLW